MTTILNLGCGTRTSPHCINIDFSIYLRLRKSRLGMRVAPLLMRGDRLSRFRQLHEPLLVHDLRRGIPQATESADAVYHSHTLEHLDRSVQQRFFAEVLRVLRLGGVHRIVVPDLELSCRRYLAHLDECLRGAGDPGQHDNYVAQIIQEMVRKEASGTSQQVRWRRVLENFLLGDARRRGLTHQWMYDRVNLADALAKAGFRDITVVDHLTSAIPDWDKIGLDNDGQGGEYKPDSLYMEAIK